MFPATITILILCGVIAYDMAWGGNILAGTVGIVAALGSITFINVGILKLWQINRTSNL